MESIQIFLKQTMMDFHIHIYEKINKKLQVRFPDTTRTVNTLPVNKLEEYLLVSLNLFDKFDAQRVVGGLIS